jgi:GT2 family glycosyltransferase/predicted transcriptional regulator
MIDLCIVIVSYNVKFFIAQCLASVYESSDTLNKEIIVIDNDSSDKSVEFIETHFPKVRLVKNTENVGFSKANNQGFKLAQSEYILILNPDTILGKDTIQQCYDFLKSNEQYGAVGVKMTDGKGTYLPESKRSLPNVLSSFFKFTLIHSLFPKSKFFNHYYLGHLSENEDHNIEVLTGAFIFTKKSVIDEVNGFDESYFMYGEDIDFCKKIIDSEKKIRYLSSAEIVHFKGESTHKNSLKYLNSFYGAMKIYALKYASSPKRPFINLAITFSILFLATLNGIKLFLKTNSQIILGLVLAFLSYSFSKWFWATYYFQNPDYFDNLIYFNLSFYSLISIICIWFTGWYDKSRKTKYLIIGAVFALIFMLFFYAILPQHWRYSRAIIFLGLSITVLCLYMMKFILELNKNILKTVIVVSRKENMTAILPFLDQKLLNYTILGFVHPSVNNDDPQYLDNIDQMQKVIVSFQPDIVIFNSKEIGMAQISQHMTIPTSKVRYLLTGIDEGSFIEPGESSKKSTVWELDPVYNLAKPIYRRTKYTIDLMIGILLILFLPLLYRKKYNGLKIIKDLISGSKTLIGYSCQNHNLPSIKSGILNTRYMIGEVINGEIVDTANKSDICYAKYYHPFMDINMVYKAIQK